VRPDGSQAYKPVCRAAIVTEVGAWITVETTVPPSFDRSEGRPIRMAEQWFYDDAMGLMVANPTGQFFNPAVPYHSPLQHDDYAGGTWHPTGECHI
jgi:hypothetical protein